MYEGWLGTRWRQEWKWLRSCWIITIRISNNGIFGLLFVCFNMASLNLSITFPLILLLLLILLLHVMLFASILICWKIFSYWYSLFREVLSGFIMKLKIVFFIFLDKRFYFYIINEVSRTTTFFKRTHRVCLVECITIE